MTLISLGFIPDHIAMPYRPYPSNNRQTKEELKDAEKASQPVELFSWWKCLLIHERRNKGADAR